MTKTELQKIAKKALGSVLDRTIKDKQLDRALVDLEMDSLDTVALAFELENELGHEIRPEIFMEEKTLNECLDTLLEELSG